MAIGAKGGLAVWRSLARRFYAPVTAPASRTRLSPFSTKPSDGEEEAEDVVEGAESGLEDHAEVDEENEHHEDSLQSDTKYPKKAPTTPFSGFGPGIYKAIVLGRIGQQPVQKMFTNGSSVVIFSVGTGGLRNNRKQFEGEAAESYAERSFTQWHRVCVFKPGLQEVATKIKKGTQVYVEGNIETRIFSDPVTGLMKRFREICVRQSGRLYVIGKEA